MYSSKRHGALVACGVWAAAVLASCGGTSKQEPQGAAGSSSAGTPAAAAGEGPSSEGGGGSGATPNEGGAGAVDSGGTATGGEPEGGAGSEACVPGATSCDGPSVRVCVEDGKSTRIQATCGPSQVCVNAACAEIACVPNDTFCAGSQLRRCLENGVDSELLEACGTGRFCSEQAGVAACTATACSPNAPLCVDQVATQCAANGSGPKAGGIDCGAEAATCEEGACVTEICKTGEKYCEHDDVYLCVGGSKTVLFSKCEADEVCDPELLACRSKICEPGKLGCDASRVATCNALGTAYVQSNIDCAASNQLCLEGSCKPKVCTPNSSYCEGNSVRRCDASGTSSTLEQSCQSGFYHCAPFSANQAFCYYNNCTPNAPACQGDKLTQCNAEGTGYVAGGVDCGTGSVCEGAACKTKVCEGYERFCKEGDIYQCSNSLSSYLSYDCGADARCLPTPQGVRCVPYDCSPGSKACLKNVVGTCASDGVTLSTVKEDCGASNQVCSTTSACAPAAVDAIGVAEEVQSYPANQVFGNVVDVLSNRQLTQLAANVVLAGERDLRWLVFEETNGAFVAKYDKLVKDQTGSGYLSSGGLDYELKAGRRYLLALAVTQGGAAVYYDAAPWPSAISFGRIVGGLATTYATTVYADYTNTQTSFVFKVTTALP
ncbi:MAG: hypothetical protein EOO73_12155 [Myxococcales bacterium]|nr:MAG: hypothetical protein EOO73_12155 [Myxococcales bacterium]